MDEQKYRQIVQDEIARYMSQKQYNFSKIPNHLHNGVDTNFISTVELPIGTPIKLGLGALVSATNSPMYTIPGATNEQYQMSIGCGSDQSGAALGTTTNNMQVNLLHQPNTSLSFLNAWRPPVYNNLPETTTSVTAAGNTITITGYNFGVDALAGALINIYNSTRTFVETQTIASNTATVITISGTWGATTTDGYFMIYNPVYLGSADNPWQRAYVCEGNTGGVRFGVGPTAAGQNGMLYMDATGNLYWRDKAGAAVQINGGGSDFLVATFGFDLQILSGSITPTNSYHTVSSEDGNNDEVTTIVGTGLATGTLLILSAANSVTDITITDGSNLCLAGDFIMDNLRDTITLMWGGSNWYEISRSDNAA